MDGAELVVEFDGATYPLIEMNELQIPGEHNISNALAAAAAALAVGVEIDEVRAGLKSFTALEHRIERAALWAVLSAITIPRRPTWMRP